MKKILVIVLLLISVVSYSQVPQAPLVVQTINQMSDYRGSLTIAKVNDALRGGIFNKVAKGSLVVDSGVVIPSIDTNFVWMRDISQSQIVNLKWFGALGNGIVDDSYAFKNAAKYKNIHVTTGIYKIDRTQIPSGVNYQVDSGVTFVSNTYEPTLIGNITYTPSYQQQTYAYKYFNPTVITDTIFQAIRGTYQYNHDVSVCYFDGKYYAMWNGNPFGGTEGAFNGIILMVTSTDGRTWSPPINVFDNASYSHNPITTAENLMKQWQPNINVYGNQMVVTWSCTNGNTGTFYSILNKGDSLFYNYRIEVAPDLSVKLNDDVNGSVTPGYTRTYPMNGEDLQLFATQNPYELNNGTVLMPFILQENGGSPNFREKRHWAVFLYTKNISDLTSYKFTKTSQASTKYAGWEPYISQSRTGNVYMHIRNLGVQDAADLDYNQEVSTSSDGLEFGIAVNDGMYGPSSRGYIQRLSNNRQVMSYNDMTDKFNRRNLVANFSRRGENDFAVGVQLQKDDPLPADEYGSYPQSCVYNDTLYIAYSQMYEPRSIIWHKFKLGLPDDSLLVIPRNRPRMYIASYANADSQWFSMSEARTWRMNKPLITGDGDSVNSHQGFSFGAWVKKQADRNGATLFQAGTKLDSSDFQAKGVAVTQQLISMGTSFQNVNLVGNISYFFNSDGWSKLSTQLLTTPSYLGVTFDVPNNEIHCYMDDGSWTSGSSTQFFTSNWYYQAIRLNQNWTDGETITIDGTIYTFKNTPTLTNDVQLGESLVVSCSNLRTKIVSSTMQLAGFGNNTNPLDYDTLVIMVFKKAAFTMSTTNASSMPYTISPYDSKYLYFGTATSATSGLQGFGGWIYNMKIYRGAANGVLSANNHRYLFNQLASRFGYSSKTSTTDPGTPYANFQYNDFSSIETYMTDTTRTECRLNGDTLILHSNSSASIESDGDAFSLNIPFQISNTTGIRAKIFTFEDKLDVNNIMVDSAGVLYLNDMSIGSIDMNAFNFLNIEYKDNIVTINGAVKYVLTGRPRLYLGASRIYNNMDGNYEIKYNIKDIKLTILK